MTWKPRLSLKFKLMSLLALTASGVLGLFAYFALSDFKQDKVAYVFDVTRSHVRSVSGQVRSELQFHANTIMQLVSQLDRSAEVLLPETYSFLKVYTYNTVEKKYDIQELAADNKSDLDDSYLSISGEMFKEAMEADVALRLVSEKQWLLALKLDVHGVQRLAFALVNEGAFVDAFYGVQAQNTYLVNFMGKIVVQSQAPTFEIAQKPLGNTIKDVIADLDTPEKVMELELNQKPWLSAAADCGIGELKVVSLLPKSAALEAVYGLAIKSLIVMGILLFATIIISVIGANGLTSALQKLSSATDKVTDGDFNVEVDVHTNDEVGSLAEGFNRMTKEIQRLIGETAEKARMEEELKTAQLVQSTLFPKPEYEDDDIQIRGYYQPASECSGDWWHYKRVGDYILMFIGDATGHGMPAALVTSATKSAAVILEKSPDIDVSYVLECLNTAVHETARGQVNMTFFVSCLNTKTGELTYGNASHDPPFLIPGNIDHAKKKDIRPLMEAAGVRLGEKADSHYKTATIQLKNNDRIVFYTDGVTELVGPNGKMWGERNFVKTLLSGFNDEKSLDSVMTKLQNNIEEFRSDQELEDDVTYFMMRYKQSG